ncbi:hypothetical protein FNU76_20230 [Chitinimonas arctica]|uniref:Uncharacterized protein n=1 Tax=Chitinimonas arctica TaxID=2594795 RepID=A0A516SK12_9NEIS|nr:hypothetical protein [Chitinimonas arctica]QDQ28497.1 hypothetical protein FNU76_20230 [Chitinimonas arctica]
MSDDALIQTLADAIRRYVRLRPHAADTVEGIHRWWMDWDDGEQACESTELALQWLAAQGEMECVVMGGREIWRATSR